MGALVCGSGFILHGIQADLHFSYDKGWGLYLGVAAVITAIVLNGYPLITAVSPPLNPSSQYFSICLISSNFCLDCFIFLYKPLNFHISSYL
jgi:hypothetical protein